VELLTRRLQQPLPEGPFDLVFSALAVHHLDAAEKAELFRRVRRVLADGGRFVLADVIVPDDPADSVIELDPDRDRPDTIGDHIALLGAAGFTPAVTWAQRDLVVIASEPAVPEVA